MKKILGMMAAVMIVGGVAMAQDEGEPAITCMSGDTRTDDPRDGVPLGNPGQAIKGIAGLVDGDGFVEGMTPPEIAEQAAENGRPVTSVGSLIQHMCFTPADD